MKYTNNQDTYIISFFEDESLINKLKEFCVKNDITAGHFTAIGALKSAKLSFYNLTKKKYKTQNFIESLEICTLTGNISTLDSKLIIHGHAALSKDDFSLIGGHLDEAIVGATCEMYLQKYPEIITRKYDEHIGLNLLDLY